MTVVPDDNLMTLICDSCGETTTSTACVLPDAEVVWTLVSEHGWSGSPFATGPHRCPRCSLLPIGARLTDAGPQADGGGLLAVDHVDDVAVLAAAGHVAPDTGEALRAALDDVVEVAGTIVVDLSQVQVIDPVGLGMLVRAHRDARERGAGLCLAAPSRFVRTVLHTMKLDGVFPTYDSLDEALADLGPASPHRTVPQARQPAASVPV
ncbi:anti-anti-sigma factor [Micromonospora nigra]|uniref:Anti-anti-sigma factor n=1 Tax=Micromonospora nigra TaxID=145857 RepID=A0A1C6R8U6_9ACTN|nr:STAS domain-containing protein [Micromonospora nigra]SCL13524.1 anti-anti-sigma factor [Micromonospora nigra]